MLTHNSSPLVSVVAISYNHERYLVDTLRSICQQTLQDFELIFLDDCSQDASVQVATRFLGSVSRNAKLITHAENKGLCYTLNEALSLCNGKYVQFISCDDILKPNKLATQTKLLEAAGSEVAVVHSDAELIDSDGKALSPWLFSSYCKATLPPREPLYETLLNGNCIAAMTTLIRRDVFQDVGGYDESLRYEDWDMWLRISKKYRFVWSGCLSAQYRIHQQNLHLNFGEWWQDNYWILKKHIDQQSVRHRIAEEMFQRVLLRTPPSIESRRDFFYWSADYPELKGIRRTIIRSRVLAWCARMIIVLRISCVIRWIFCRLSISGFALGDSRRKFE